MLATGTRQMPHVENNRVVENTNEARAGVTGHNVRFVLLIGLVAVILLSTLAYIASLNAWAGSEARPSVHGKLRIPLPG
jgi:hypothetical protein